MGNLRTVVNYEASWRVSLIILASPALSLVFADMNFFNLSKRNYKKWLNMETCGFLKTCRAGEVIDPPQRSVCVRKFPISSLISIKNTIKNCWGEEWFGSSCCLGRWYLRYWKRRWSIIWAPSPSFKIPLFKKYLKFIYHFLSNFLMSPNSLYNTICRSKKCFYGRKEHFEVFIDGHFFC